MCIVQHRHDLEVDLTQPHAHAQHSIWRGSSLTRQEGKDLQNRQAGDDWATTEKGPPWRLRMQWGLGKGVLELLKAC